ncbi:MAG: SARP family transcriptional regulator [Rhodococcus sp. (in: high G+C Gram-positive bacteria)]|nr:MAG: SARP family transcriptional regulator [Rhodococcus sp. (in: high G+C Gram-positive bacteria)]
MLTVYLLGEQRVSDPADSRVGPISSRAIALLAYLVLHAGLAQSRTRLAGLFWPESSEQQARTNLRRELHNLRGLLGADGALAADGPTLTWTGSPSCRVDVDTFRNERSTALAALADSDPRAFLDHADRAIDVYRGELMPGTYEDWVLDHREVLRRQCVELCGATVRVLRESGDVDTATACARRRIQLDPLEEVGYRTLMELQAASGDRAAAMTTYHRCAAVLETELGVAPSPATARLFDNLLGEHSKPGSAGAHRPERARTAVPTLIGREQERGEVHRRWQQALDGRQGLLLVSGDAGVGKTRLTTELAEIARADGAVVASTRCFGLPVPVALAPVAEWLRSPDLQSAIASLNPLWRAEVERLVPSAESWPRPATSRAMVDAWQRHRFFEGTARAVLSSGRPVLLVLDDLQWCDAETTAWLAFLLSLETRMRVLVAATARTDEVQSRRDVREALRALRSARLVSDLEVDPLTPDGTAELARSLGGRTLDPSEEAVLYAATGGYPLYVVEAARMVPGSDATEAGGDAGDLGEVLQRRLEQCSEPARDVAGLAAALGTDFDLDLLSEASDLDTDPLVQAVDELWRRRIVRPEGTGYDFVHDLVREAAYRSVGPPRRWLLHRRLAQGLELLHTGRTDDVAAQLAEQYRRGGRPDRALHYQQRAAEVAAGVFANAEALRHFRYCLDLLEAMPAGRNRDACEVEVRQGMSAPLTTLYGYSSAELEQTLDRTAELGQQLRRPTVVLAALIGLFAVHFVQGHTARAHRIGLRALELSAADPAFEGQAQFAVAGAALGLGRPAEAIEHFDLARGAFSDDYSFILGTRLEVHAHAWESHAYWMIGDEEAAAQSCAEALALGRTCGHPYSLAVALGYASVLHQLRGDDVALLASVTELRELCERYHFAYYSQWSQILEGRLLGGERGIAKIREGLAELRRQRAFARMPYWLSLLAEVQIDVGDVDAARATLDAARIAAEQHDDRGWLPQVPRLRAEAGPFAGGPSPRTVRERRIPTV